ncbi:hypothetical protein [Lonsdalea quercina]|uniref:hypothetical protein n=1 Tax=Lonsdalea quercina TaxID=71657 RepID=UPI003975CDB9
MRFCEVSASGKMPLEIDAAGFDNKLSMTDKNIEHTENFISKGVTEFNLSGFIVPHGYKLLRSRSQDQYRLVTDGSVPETVYAVKLSFLDNIIPARKTCTQIMVWRTIQPQHEHAVHGLPQKFFRYFLSVYSIVVSDSEQTKEGRRFWERMIAWAMKENGYQVYVSDGTKEERPITLMTSWDDFYGVWAQFCWGSDKDCHPHRLLVISSETLH